MMMALLNSADYNVIRVEWSEGSSGLYGSAVANSRIAGAEISLLMDRLKVGDMCKRSNIKAITHFESFKILICIPYTAGTEIGNSTT